MKSPIVGSNISGVVEAQALSNNSFTGVVAILQG